LPEKKACSDAGRKGLRRPGKSQRFSRWIALHGLYDAVHGPVLQTGHVGAPCSIKGENRTTIMPSRFSVQVLHAEGKRINQQSRIHQSAVPYQFQWIYENRKCNPAN
jgi:hypothetical protein